MLTQRERFIALVDNDPLHFADVIAVFEGDGWHRMDHGAALYESGLAPEIFVTGGMNNPKAGCIPANRMKRLLEFNYIPENMITIDTSSMNTHEQAVALARRANDECWDRVLLVASHYHQYRAYLTCLKAMRMLGREFWIINAPARDIPWYEDEGWGKRIDLLDSEFAKIEEYAALGHLTDFDFAIEYQRRKEEALR